MKQILFEDNFNGDRLKPTWHTRTHNGDPSAVDVSNGSVHLRTLWAPDGGVLSGHIGTGEVHGTNAFEITPPCWVEARVRFHPYHGSHGAVWLAPSTDYEPGQSEVDIAEHFGAHNPRRKRGVLLRHNVYWREEGQGIGQFSEKVATVNNTDLGVRWDDWNVYSLRWTRKSYTFFVNGDRTATITEGLSSKPHFLVLSLLTGGYEEPNLHHGHPMPVMDVDWVKVWRTV